MAVLGVDGWRGAWVGALLEGRGVRLLALADVATVLAVPDVDVVAIDMPIGLSEDGVRACDVGARQLLEATGAASSVFPSPVRAVLDARDHAHARELSRAATGGVRAPSAQTFVLVAAIRALDDGLGTPPTDRVVEVHPELTFRCGLGGVTDRTGTARGTVQRLAALRAVMDVEDALADAPVGVPVVDALDACAAAWPGRRLAEGRAGCVGDGTTDTRGRPMRICW
ncbi:Putative NUDIX hydrolase [Modestobacter italicus]|uniref:NUDIX hydrolase n=1 Tax=Modestobacter italicus (strain DSM 44449 / CECT 9708 / BC 501) TaxID=2732864 RepID=I4EUD9_MODI5|nr:Putative NUDIX hydrolase [Modestobacter marinus]